MKYGVVFPQIEFGNDIQAIKDYAQTAEGLGYDYLLVYDHVLGAHPSREPKLTGPYTYEHPFHELCRRLLGRRVSEYGRLCHGDGGHEGGDRRRRALMLTILSG
jgi:hypothetical protein